jgi:hypothetical protein
MKKKAQVTSFLKKVSVSEKDAFAIEAYLKRNGINHQFGETMSSDLVGTILYEDFKRWFEGMPEPGEAIVSESQGWIGIVKENNVETITMGVLLKDSNTLASTEVQMSNPDFRMATEEERIALQRKLNEAGLSWNCFKNELVKSHTPGNNHQIRISRLGKKHATGVFREINSKGEIVLYVYRTKEHLKYSLYEVVGPACDYQMEVINPQERKKLISELEAAGKTWNGHAKRIEPLNFKVDKGELYYYIDHYFNVVPVSDHDKPRDRKHLKSGNYFRTRTEAEVMLSVISNKRNELLMGYSEEEKTEKTKRGRKKKAN